ncbi:MAG: sugar phosphate isomerase/epimerase family protein [Nocardioidaceae bacterium]
MTVDVPSGRYAIDPTPGRGDARLARLSLNQKTTNRWTVAESVEGCSRAGLPAIGLWREPVQETGIAVTASMVADAGLRVSSLCRGGFLTAEDATQRGRALEDNRCAIEEAATLGADCLVMVVGGLPEGSRDLAGARNRVAEGIGVLAPYAEKCSVRLALEPMHPIYCADRGVLSTLGQALDLAEQFPAEQVGVVVDTFHVWWDPDVLNQIARAAGRVYSFQVCDWITPLPPNALLCRGMMGDGHIDFATLRRAVDAAGYHGDIEVEIFNADVWAADPDAVVATMARRYVTHVLGD